MSKGGKVVNIRVPLALCVSLVCGIALAYFAFRAGFSAFYLLALLPLCAVLTAIATAITRNFRTLAACVLAMLFLTVGIIYGWYIINDVSSSVAPDGENYIQGTVYSLVIGDDGRELTLTDVYVEGEPLDGKVLVILANTGGELCDEGDTVSFTAELTAYDFITYGAVNSHVIEGVRYYCNVYAGLEATGGFSFFGAMRAFIRERLYDNLDKSVAGVAYAMLTGDTEGCEDGIMSTFRYGGIAHIFAVSGLHIGVVYGALVSLCRLFKRRGWVSSLACVAAVVVYSGMCGFTVSSVRAVIMCAVSACARLTGLKYDTLNSLSAAVIIILLINPLDLFSTGFKLSVLAVLGIALYNATLRKRLAFMPFNTGEGLAVSFSAQIGTFPAMLSCFGYVSAAGFILNFIFIPLLSAAFMCMLAGVLLSAPLFPAAGVIISAAALPLEGVLSILALGSFEEALFCLFGGRLFTIAYYIFAVLLSDKIRKHVTVRRVLCVLAALSVALFAVFVSAYPVNGTYISISAYYGGGYVLFKDEGGTALVVTDGVTVYKLRAFLTSNAVESVGTLVILGGEDCADFIYEVGISFDKAYIYGGYLQSEVGSLQVAASDTFTVSGMAFKFLDGYTVICEADGVKSGICAGELVPSGCDILIGDMAFDESGEAATAYKVNFSSGSGDWCAYSGGKLCFTARGGGLYKSRVF